MTVIDCAALPITIDCCFGGAAAYVPLPAWLKSITHVPACGNETTPPLNEQPVLVESSAIATVSPDDAVAAGVYDAPPTVAPVGAVEVIVIDCDCEPPAEPVIVNDCSRWRAGENDALPA